MKYDAFISCSHAADGALAPALQRGLHRPAKPLYALRAVRVYRDETNLAADPGMWTAIYATRPSGLGPRSCRLRLPFAWRRSRRTVGAVQARTSRLTYAAGKAAIARKDWPGVIASLSSAALRDTRNAVGRGGSSSSKRSRPEASRATSPGEAEAHERCCPSSLAHGRDPRRHPHSPSVSIAFRGPECLHPADPVALYHALQGVQAAPARGSLAI